MSHLYFPPNKKKSWILDSPHNETLAIRKQRILDHSDKSLFCFFFLPRETRHVGVDLTSAGFLKRHDKNVSQVEPGTDALPWRLDKRERERRKKKMVKPPHIHSRAGVLSRRKLNWGRRGFTVRTALERSGREVTMSSWCFFRRFKSGEEAY